MVYWVLSGRAFFDDQKAELDETGLHLDRNSGLLTCTDGTDNNLRPERESVEGGNLPRVAKDKANHW